MWERLNEKDILLFYATQPVSGIIGYGVVRTKVKQDKPLWPQEVREQNVIWPLRFEFDVEVCLPPDKWKNNRVVSKDINPRSGFQIISQSIAEEVKSHFKLTEYIVRRDEPSVIAEVNAEFLEIPDMQKVRFPTHDEVKKTLVEIGRLQKFIAEEEYQFDIGRLDVVWRRVELSVPTYVFEVQVGGDVYHALAKLKHAFDLWNSHIFVVAQQSERRKVNSLLTGTFHEIDSRLKFIELGIVDELYRRKRAYMDLEKELGI